MPQMRSFHVCILLMLLWVSAQASLLQFEPHKSEKSSTNIWVCPDKSECPDQDTCCEVKSGKWACCPYPGAVCCKDKEHCCPSGYQCDVAASQCVHKDGEIVSWSKKLPASALPQDKMTDALKISRGTSVTCPDQKSQCMDDQTCCQLSSGQWACCPLPQAVCCPDHEHCCPQFYTCDPARGACIKGSLETLLKVAPMFLPWLNYRPAEALSIVQCDDQMACEDGQTCCKLQGGGYGCCHLPNAVCCSDGIHCCPNDYTCNLSAGTCDQFLTQIPWSTKVPAIQHHSSPDTSVVPSSEGKSCSGEAWCKPGRTCCESKDGNVRGCCPVDNAVCCSDGLHCCPTGTTCDAGSGMCRSVDISLAFTWQVTHRIDGFGGLRTIESAPCQSCPNNSTCPSGNTCCQLSSKQYSCCPYENAVCCKDQLHCCPHDMTCDIKHSRCVQKGFSTPWTLFSRNHAKHPSVVLQDLKFTLNKDTCPDLTSICAENTTCCLMQSGAYGCCPHKNAVCCSDKLHCCPYGTTCDIDKQDCVASVSTDNKQDRLKNKKQDDYENDIPFPIMNPYRRLN